MHPRGTQASADTGILVYWVSCGGYNLPMRTSLFRTFLLLLSLATIGTGFGVALAASEELHIEITKKGLGKEVLITQGTREWFMMVEVTPENTVIVRQEKDRDQYLVDESETHDRPLASVEVDAAINDYVNSVKARAPKK
jgi:hypothetical protein